MSAVAELPTTMHTAVPTAVSNPASASDIDPIVWRQDLQAELQVSGETVRRWLAANRLPKPDIYPTRQTMGWKLSTLKAAGFNLR